MTNAREELLNTLKGLPKMICATINYRANGNATTKTVNLKVGHSDDDLQAFYEALDFKYDAGFGTQKLFGTIWLENGSWLDRGQYDGSEWWAYRKKPNIDKNLLSE